MRNISAITSKIMAGTALAAFASAAIAVPFVNEFHYDNDGTDVGEFFEIAGEAGTSLDGYRLALYNGTESQRSVYDTINLSGMFTNQSGGFGFLDFGLPSNGIQNGSPDGFALIDAANNVLQFLSYEGSFVAASGPAAGMTSVDIGVQETSSTPVGFSLQLTGSGGSAGDFTWQAPSVATRGALNTGQSFTGGTPSPTPTPTPTPTPSSVAIYDIQGEGHVSGRVGETVTTTGVVTRVERNGYYVQDATGDGNDATSDAIFVFTGAAPGVTVGNRVEVSGTVGEFVPGGASSGNLSQTQLSGGTTTVTAMSAPLPAATIIGTGGRLPPTNIIEDDNFSSFDPATDGIDFYESLEGMVVTVAGAQALGPTNRFGETYVVALGGAGATNLNARGGLTLAENDFNPERLQIQAGAYRRVHRRPAGRCHRRHRLWLWQFRAAAGKRCQSDAGRAGAGNDHDRHGA